MSNSRTLVSTVADHVRTDLANPAVRVGHLYQPDYATAVKNTWPAVWVCGHLYTALGDAKGMSGHYRQRHRLEFIVRIALPRYIQGEVDGDLEDRIAALYDPVVNSIIGWHMPGSEEGFGFSRSQDAPAPDTLIWIDIVFSTVVARSGVPR